MPGKIKSKAEQAFLAIHHPDVLHELSGGHIPKGLPEHVGKPKKPKGVGKRKGLGRPPLKEYVGA